MAANRDRLVLQARMALVASRYDDMVSTMKEVATSFQMTKKERELFYLSFKGQLQYRRESMHKLAEKMKIAEGKKDEMTVSVIKELTTKIQGEVLSVCTEAIEFLNSNVITNRLSAEDTLFFFTMKGDFYRYTYEAMPSELTRKMVINTYKRAEGICSKLENPSADELDLFQKYASFCHHQLNDTSSAMDLLNAAIVKVQSVHPTRRDDELKFMIDELYILVNKLDRPSPFMNTQQNIEEILGPDVFDTNGSEEQQPQFKLFSQYTCEDLNFNSNFFEDDKLQGLNFDFGA